VKSKDRKDTEAEVIEKIAAMPVPFRPLGERVHALIVQTAPALQPMTWYGMPGYAKDGKVVCFFRADKKYMTFGFTQDVDVAPPKDAPDQLIESAWYFNTLDAATEAKLAAIVRKVAS
jgi:hypothetical protein